MSSSAGDPGSMPLTAETGGPRPRTAVHRVVTWALADQAVMSGCNFLTVLLVARALPQAAFGIYTVAYTSLYISNTIQSSLIAEPHAVLSASRLGRAYVDYTTSTGVMQLFLAAVIANLAAIVALIVGAGATSAIILALGLAAIGWQLQEFCRRVLYVEDRVGEALINDTVSYGGQLVVVGVLAAAGALNEVSAILAVGGTSLIAAALGAVQLRKSLVGRPARADIRDNLRFGKWLAANELTGIFSLRLWAYLIAAIAGAAAAGTYGAATLIVGPFNVIVFSVGTVLPIRLSQARLQGGEGRMRAMLRRFHVWTVPPIVVISLVLAVLAEPIASILYQGKYPGLGALVAALAFYNVVRYLQALVSVALSASQRSRALFTSSLIGGAFTIVTGWWLVDRYGVGGAAAGLIAATLATLGANWVAFLRAPGSVGRDRGPGYAGDLGVEPAGPMASRRSDARSAPRPRLGASQRIVRWLAGASRPGTPS